MREAFKPALREAHGAALARKRAATPEPLRPLTAPTLAAGALLTEGGGALSPPPAPDALPPFLSAAGIVPSSIVTPPLLIEHLLHRGCKMVLAGGSKSYKSWSLVDLGLSVATGEPWWGMRCQQGVVVYVNFELIQGFLEHRIHQICMSREIKMPDWFLYWNLRHKCYDLSTVARVLRSRIEAQQIRVDLIIVDPIYKALGGLDENSAGDMSVLMEGIEDLSETTGAAVVFGAHFSKGNQSGKESKDRISGSGVFGRDPDAILTMTRHTQDNCYVVESDLRYVPPLPEFVVQWKFPVMSVNEGLDPTDILVPGPPKKTLPAEERAMLTDEQVLECLAHHGVQDATWKFAVKTKHGRNGKDYYQAKKRLIDQGRVVRKGLKYVPTEYALQHD